MEKGLLLLMTLQQNHLLQQQQGKGRGRVQLWAPKPSLGAKQGPKLARAKQQLAKRAKQGHQHLHHHQQQQQQQHQAVLYLQVVFLRLPLQRWQLQHLAQRQQLQQRSNRVQHQRQ
jgi:hypothetical protein